MRTISVDQTQQMARGTIVLEQPTLVTEIQLGSLPSGEPAIPRLRILINGKTAAESYWQTPAPAADDQVQHRYVYPGPEGVEAGCSGAI